MGGLRRQFGRITVREDRERINFIRSSYEEKCFEEMGRLGSCWKKGNLIS